MSNIDEINKGGKEDERLIKEERELEEAYVAAGLGCSIPTYYLGLRPACVEEHGGAINVYRECLEKDISWQKLCNFKLTKGMRMDSEEQLNIEYFCFMIEYITRKAHLHRSDVIAHFDDDDIDWQLRVAL